MTAKGKNNHTHLLPAEPVSPGEILREELEARNWTQETFAEIIDKPLQAVNEIINAKKSITPETAILFSAAFGTSAELWLNLESNYRLGRAEITGKENTAARKAYLYSIMPVSELIKRKWIEAGRTIDELEENVCSFFNVHDIGSLKPTLSQLRAGRGKKPFLGAIISWLRKVEIEGAKISVPPFKPEVLKAAIPDIARLSKDEENGPQKAIDALNGFGVLVVLLKHLKGTYIDGAAMFDQKGQPIIGLSLRMKRLDNFWFTLFHELGHILLHSEKMSKLPFVDLKEDCWKDSRRGDERAANHFAREAMIPLKKFNEFIQAHSDFYSEDTIIEFAESMGISPAIVVGRLHWERKMGYEKLRKLLGKVKLNAA